MPRHPVRPGAVLIAACLLLALVQEADARLRPARGHGPARAATAAAPAPALEVAGRDPRPARLLARDGDRLIQVSGRLLRAGPSFRRGAAEGVMELASPALALAAVGTRWFVSEASGDVTEVRQDLRPRGRVAGGRMVVAGAGRPVRLAAMDDHLVLAEDGTGVRIFRAHSPHAGSHGAGHGPALSLAAPELVGGLSLPVGFTAVAGDSRRIFAATTEGAIAVIDAARPEAPVVARWLESGPGITDLAATGDLLYVLRRDGLEALDLAASEPGVVLRAPAAGGTSLELAGRRLDIASNLTGVTTYINRTQAALVVNVNVNNNFFSPEDVVIQPGDSVRWRNLSGFHNVVSCVPEQMGCDGQLSDETFTSGPSLGPPWLFIYTFETPSFNPYICIPHAPFMRGTVTVEAPPPPPLPVAVDVKPGSCVNPVNTRSRGVLPVAILGSAELDVATIQVESLRLSGVAPLRASFEDVGGPAETESAAGPCGAPCPSGEPDGHLDLTLKFDQSQVLAALGALADGQCAMLDLTGRLLGPDGERELVGQDSVRVLARPPARP